MSCFCQGWVFPGWLQTSGNRGWYRGAQGLLSQTLIPAHITSGCRGCAAARVVLAPSATNTAHACTSGCAKCLREKAFNSESSNVGHLSMRTPNTLSVMLQRPAGSAARVWQSLSCRSLSWGDRRACVALHLSVFMSFLSWARNREILTSASRGVCHTGAPVCV